LLEAFAGVKGRDKDSLNQPIPFSYKEGMARFDQVLPVNLSSADMLNSMTSRPMVTMISSTNPNQPSTIAAVPTPLLTLPFPKSSDMDAAATEAVCCHNTLTRTKIEAMKTRASATWQTGREGKGLTSISEPVSSSCS
jgi:hypothetical protein